MRIAHAVAGGGDPAKMIEKYHGRILFLHIKDIRNIPANTPNAKYPFEFVELGRGRVDLPSVFTALNKVKFHRWAVVELDRVPDKSRTPKESVLISKAYLEQKSASRSSSSPKALSCTGVQTLLS